MPVRCNTDTGIADKEFDEIILYIITKSYATGICVFDGIFNDIGKDGI